MQDYFSKIAVLENEFEAGLISAILDERDIPHIMRTYYDAAYDGMFQLQKGWGTVDAPASYKPEILGILDQLRADANARVEEAGA